MSQSTLAYLCAITAMFGLMAYILLGGADFGGGIWDLLARGPRKQQQRHAIEHAMGPVWEANHVWLIFVIVILFTCFPVAFSVLCVGLFIPLHLILLGIILRGAAFVFRKYGLRKRSMRNRRGLLRAPNITSPRLWGAIFGAASTISPLLLGAAFGAVTSGGLRYAPATGKITVGPGIPWLTPYAISCGFLALSTCAYLSAVYLTLEASGEVRDDFRRRAIATGTSTVILAGIVLICAQREAPWFVRQLFSLEALPIVAVGLAFFLASAITVFGRRYRLSCVFAVGQIVTLLLGWAVAHRAYLVYPDVRLLASAAPATTLQFTLIIVVCGLVVLLPSLWLLFRVFKGEHLANRSNRNSPQRT